MQKLHPTQKERQCGDCTLCCKVFAVPDLNKERQVWCQYCNPEQGCSIHKIRPQVCRDFKCQWLLGNIPIDWKPNKIHAVIHIDKDNKLLIIPNKSIPGVTYQPPLVNIINHLASHTTLTITEER